MNTPKTKSSLLVAAAVALLSLPALAGDSAAEKFKSKDTNGDGRISRDEHVAAARQMYTNLDTDRDGSISASELSASGDLKGGKGADKLKQADANNDGVISASEQEASCEDMFAKLDANSDGFVTESEFTAGHDRMKHN